jgi:hypothetical protein
VNKTQEQFPRQGEYFSFDGEALIPEQTAVSGWGANLMFGPAVTAALARGAELACPAPDLQPAKASFDLFRPALMMPSTVRTTVVRQGRRLCLIDVAFVQDVMDIARGRSPSSCPALTRPDRSGGRRSTSPRPTNRSIRTSRDASTAARRTGAVMRATMRTMPASRSGNAIIPSSAASDPHHSNSRQPPVT